MPKRRELKSLLQIAIFNVHYLVRNEALRISTIITDNDNEFHYKATDKNDDNNQHNGDLDMIKEIYLKKQIENFKEHLFSHIPSHLLDRILDPILSGINDAISFKKKEWDPTTNMSKFTKSIQTITEFSHLLILPSRKTLNLQKVPKVIRNYLFKSFPKFSNVTILILANGIGGGNKLRVEKLSSGLPYMKSLVHFSLNYDCTRAILKVLSENCWKTLRILDIERSIQIQDDSIDFIKMCSSLIKINIFQGRRSHQKACLSLEGQVCKKNTIKFL